jgi:hypothetical protein
LKCLYVIIILLVVLPASVYASLPSPPDTLWAMTYDAGDVEKAFRARTADDGGYIICGSTRSPGPGDTDAYLVRTGPAGDVIWARNYGGAHTEEVYDVVQTSDGGYAAIGYTSTNTAGYFDVYLIRTDAGGDTLWTKTYGGIDYDYGYSVEETPGGGFIIAGRTSSFGNGWRSAYFIRTDADGDTLWTRAHGGSGKDEAYSVVALAGGGYLAAGYTESYGAGGSDIWLIRLDAAGDTLWTRTYGGALNERGEDIRPTADKGFVIAGRSSSFNPPLYDMYLVRIDAAGDTLWTRTYGGAAMEHAYSVDQALDGGFVVAGYTDSFGSGARDAYVVRCDAAGDTLWTKTLGGTSADYGYSAEQIAGGGYMVCGWTFSMGTGDGDAFLAVLAPAGGCPQIQQVSDVPSDEGGYVEVSWLPSFYDNIVLEGGIKRYKIWREVNQPVIDFGATAADEPGTVHRPADRRKLTEHGGLWQLIGQVPAVAGSVYTYIAPTTCGAMNSDLCLGCFIVSAHTGALGEHFESPAMCGYAVYNLGGPGGSAANDNRQPPAEAYLRVISPPGGGAGYRIDFSAPEDGRASIELFSVTGRKVVTLLDKDLKAGAHSVEAGSLDRSLQDLAPGTYFVRLGTASVSKSAKLVIVR